MRHLLPLLLIHSLWSHDLYLMPQKFRPAPGEKILLSAHTGDSFPLSEQPIDPERLTAVPAIATEEWRMANKATHATVVAKEGSQYYAIYSKQRFLEMEPDKFEDYLKGEGLTTQIALRKQKNELQMKSREMYAKYAKTYVVAGKPTPGFDKPIGLKVEIVPLTDPASLMPGSTLPVQLLFNNKPLADAQIELAIFEKPGARPRLKPAGRTDANGKLMVTIPTGGKVRLHSVAMIRVAEPTHDWESYWASLTFEVPTL